MISVFRNLIIWPLYVVFNLFSLSHQTKKSTRKRLWAAIKVWRCDKLHHFFCLCVLNSWNRVTKKWYVLSYLVIVCLSIKMASNSKDNRVGWVWFLLHKAINLIFSSIKLGMVNEDLLNTWNSLHDFSSSNDDEEFQ